jgi:hypothetical protein
MGAGFLPPTPPLVAARPMTEEETFFYEQRNLKG